MTHAHQHPDNRLATPPENLPRSWNGGRPSAQKTGGKAAAGRSDPFAWVRGPVVETNKPDRQCATHAETC